MEQQGFNLERSDFVNEETGLDAESSEETSDSEEEMIHPKH